MLSKVEKSQHTKKDRLPHSMRGEKRTVNAHTLFLRLKPKYEEYMTENVSDHFI
jgi:hypothetical protein